MEEKMSVLPEFKLVLSEPDLLKEPIKNIKSLVSEAKIKVGLDKLSLIEMDAANISMSIFELMSSAFVEWDVREEFVMGLNLQNFSSILNNVKKDDILVLKRNEDNKLGIELRGRTTRQFEIPIMDIGTKEEKIPDLKFNTRIRMPTKDLYEQIESADVVAETVTFKAENGKFIVSAAGDLSKFKAENKSDDEVSIEIMENSEARYSIEYLKKMLNASKISDEVQLEFGNDYPLKVTFKAIDRFKLEHILAPRITDD